MSDGILSAGDLAEIRQYAYDADSFPPLESPTFKAVYKLFFRLCGPAALHRSDCELLSNIALTYGERGILREGSLYASKNPRAAIEISKQLVRIASELQRVGLTKNISDKSDVLNYYNAIRSYQAMVWH